MLGEGRAASAQREAGRAFGLMIAALLIAMAAYRWCFGHPPVASLVMLAAGMLAAALSLFRPSWLDPVARVWLRFGELLGMIVSPIVLAAIFFLLVTPIAIVARWLGRDELRLKPPPGDSYWVAKEPPQPQNNSFERPF